MIKIELLIGYLILFLFLSTCNTLRNPCGIDREQWLADECGFSGYRNEIWYCILEKSQKQPIFKSEKATLSLLGKPDTVFYIEGQKMFHYVTSGSVHKGNCYNEGELQSLQIFVNGKGKVISVSGGIH